jgi:hypothetical protein
MCFFEEANMSKRRLTVQEPVEIDADTQSQLQQVVDYYHQTLKTSPVGLAYLVGWGLGSREMVDPRTLNSETLNVFPRGSPGSV